MFAENGHDRNYLNSTIKENKHQAPKTENTDGKIVKTPWITIIGTKIRKELRKTKIRKELRKTGCKVISTSAANLKNILCNNKTKLLPNSYPGVRGDDTLEK